MSSLHDEEDSNPGRSPDSDRGSSVQAARSERRRHRWFQQPATLIAALALSVSLASTIITVENNRSQATSDRRNQLLTLVEDLTRATQIEAQIASTYKNDASTRVTLQANEQTAQIVQSEEAGEIIDSLDGNVAPAEAYEVGYAFSRNGNYEKALRYLHAALRRGATEPNIVAATYREEATVWYTLGNLQAAFRAEALAYGATSSHRLSRGIDLFNRAHTDLFGIGWAVNVGACDHARADLTDAKKVLKALAFSKPAAYLEEAQRLRVLMPRVSSCRATR